MIEITVIILLLIATAIFFKTQKKASETVVKHEDKVSQEPVQQQDAKLAAEPKVEIEVKQATAVEPQSQQPVLTAKPEDAVKPVSQKSQNSLKIPEDSALRRHYFSQVQALVEELLPSRPTDATLRRHYNAMLADRLEECLSNKEAMDRLVSECQLHKQVSAKQTSVTTPSDHPVNTVTNPEQSNSQVPEDSMLSRHYFTHLRSLG